ncbi:hypothetical protein Bca101_092143 [Brassica carinata]
MTLTKRLVGGNPLVKNKKNRTLQSEQPKDYSSGGTTHRLFQSPAEQTPRSHRPGKAPMGTCTSTEEVHRSHNRCSFYPAESGESN